MIDTHPFKYRLVMTGIGIGLRALLLEPPTPTGDVFADLLIAMSSTHGQLVNFLAMPVLAGVPSSCTGVRRSWATSASSDSRVRRARSSRARSSTSRAWTSDRTRSTWVAAKKKEILKQKGKRSAAEKYGFVTCYAMRGCALTRKGSYVKVEVCVQPMRRGQSSTSTSVARIPVASISSRMW